MKFAAMKPGEQIALLEPVDLFGDNQMTPARLKAKLSVPYEATIGILLIHSSLRVAFNTSECHATFIEHMDPQGSIIFYDDKIDM